ncbi:putative heat shock protein YegD [Rhodovastum atsumiense]|uniref:Hsp70 family protein n=1 Tax=Rhodovastum atsumiense TaxID=504468 RepID=A0A5M6ITR9_9PROT|nr:Hsp70 family protein [Rhodovastum atsumiense]KAA5611706.1 Hsp70 family protein [Rhodovastum atsumiense]CAH2604283.1 putative heat shock protein YegD [Rhodovastum atsumiense]
MLQVGIDFGTTNSVIALLTPDGAVHTARFGPDAHEVFRSVLCFWSEEQRGGPRLHHAAGPGAITAWLDDPLESRLIMSMKSYLAQPSFVETRIFGRRFTLPDLVALFLRALAESAGVVPATLRVVAGRPVRFAGEFADDALGEQRLRESFTAAGFTDVSVALEPEGAGWRFARTLTRPATVLIGDFGGGTSDFSLLRFVPGEGMQPLGHAGVGIAGDSFDVRIIDHVVSPRLGRGDTYTVMGKELPVPPEWFITFARWHRLSLMRSPKTLRDIAEVARTARHPERLQALLALIEAEQGFRLYQTVSAAKAALSTADSTVLRFTYGDLRIEETITRTDFEAWIAPDLARLEAAVDEALQAAGVAATEVDHVFLTGGTSFVPAVRRLFETRFGAGRVMAGGEFVSVAEGLALIGQERAAAA